MTRTKTIDPLQEEKRLIERAGSLHWFHWLVVIFSLILTIAAWYITKQSINDKIAIQFDRQAKQAVELVAERMQKYEDGLSGGVSMIQVLDGDISLSQWRIFANSLRIGVKYPGINGIGVIYYIPPASLPTYLAKQRQARPDFTIYPPHNRNEYWPITYIEPEKTNAKAVGLDMAHEANRYTAAVKARDTNTAQITGPITLVQDAEKTPGFLFYVPFYNGTQLKSVESRQQHFIGLVYAPFVMKNLMQGTLQKAKRQVAIKISDGNDVLFDEHTTTTPDYDPQPLFANQYELDLYGRTWVFDIRSAKSFRELSGNNQPMIILIGGIMLDTLLLTLFIMLANTNRRAINFINQMTATTR